MALSGRQAQAARNDEAILRAAREVFTADPLAPIAKVAQHAGVGISALYRRYRSKDELLQQLCLEAIRHYTALAEGDDLAAFLRNAVDSGAGSLTLHLAGTFTVTDELLAELPRAVEATQRLLEHAKTSAELRPEIEVGDILLVLEQVQAINLGDSARTHELRHRYLALLLAGMRPAGGRALPGPALPGPAPAWDEIERRYRRG